MKNIIDAVNNQIWSIGKPIWGKVIQFAFFCTVDILVHLAGQNIFVLFKFTLFITLFFLSLWDVWIIMYDGVLKDELFESAYKRLLLL